MITTISYAVPATALRVFHGFRNQTLDQDQYLRALGQTFMPGTPYMLAPLGLAAYLPGIVVGEQDSRVPHEFAIIAYPSPETWITRCIRHFAVACTIKHMVGSPI